MIKNPICTFLFVCIMLFFSTLTSQIEAPSYDFQYDVVQVYKPLSVAKASLIKANKVEDLHRHYKDSWVKEYLHVDVSAHIDGKLETQTSKDQKLSVKQKQLMLNADRGTEIEVVVNYIPDNTLKNNEPKKFDFAFMVNPEKDASFKGGEKKLIQTIKKDLIDVASWESLNQYQLAVVKFVVDTDGRIIEPKIFWSSDDQETDAKMIDFVCNMPAWEPAQYDTGKKIAQEYALTIGDNNSCVVPMLNTKEN